MFPKDSQVHIPVMISEMSQALDIRPHEIYIDGTFGRGGYSREILRTEETIVWAIDRDPEAIQEAESFKQTYPQRFHLISGCFGDMKDLLEAEGILQVDGIVLDIGVSSAQIDTPTRGFSFKNSGPLDMRMSQTGISAADVVNGLSEEELAHVIYTWGEERFSRSIARKIVTARQEKPLTTTQELADLVRSVVRRHADGIDPATRTFQALRIYVNDELGELQRALNGAAYLLKPGGRLVVITFHSLEDRCVKNFFRTYSQQQQPLSRYQPAPLNPFKEKPPFELITRRSLSASRSEIRFNARSRSAKLRAARRTEAPFYPSQELAS